MQLGRTRYLWVKDMEERERLNGTDPDWMLRFLLNSGQASHRKVRLFAWVCLRRIWHLLPYERDRKALEIEEHLADGGLDTEEQVVGPETQSHDPFAMSYAAPRTIDAASEASGADIAAFRARPWAERAVQYAAAPGHANWQLAMEKVGEMVEAAQAALLRDLFGNPLGSLPPILRTKHE
jgi:hypothetical protein